MNIHLVAVAAFATYAKGDLIADQVAIATILDSENKRHVVRVSPLAPQGS